jgi:hypothetical protein
MSSVTLSATGMPPGATVTFTPATLVPASGPTTTTMTITTSASTGTTAKNSAAPLARAAYIAYGLLVFPLFGIRRFRRRLRTLPRAAAHLLLLLAALSVTAALSGCAGGYFGNAPQQYSIAVTGVSGNHVHSTTVTLAVR